MNEVFKALADPTRREILKVLRNGEKSAGELAELFNLAKSTLSGHFSVLKAAKLVITEKRGTTVMYKLNSSVFEEAMTHVMDIFNIDESREQERDKNTADKEAENENN